MENKKKVKKIESKTKIKQIEKTPFSFLEHDGKKFITCGNVKLEVDNEIENLKDFEKWRDSYVNYWHAMSILCQAITHEMINEYLNKN